MWNTFEGGLARRAGRLSPRLALNRVRGDAFIHTHYADEVRLAVSTLTAAAAATGSGLNGILGRCYFSGRFAPSLRGRRGREDGGR